MPAVLTRPRRAVAASPKDDFDVLFAAVTLQWACAEAIQDRRVLEVALEANPVEAILTTAHGLIAGNPEATRAVRVLRTFTVAETLRARRITLDIGRLTRTAAALELAAHRGNPAAFDTLLRRGLDLIVRPLQNA